MFRFFVIAIQRYYPDAGRRINIVANDLSGFSGHSETVLRRKNPDQMKPLMYKNIYDIGVSNNRCLIGNNTNLLVLQQWIIEFGSFSPGNDLCIDYCRDKQE